MKIKLRRVGLPLLFEATNEAGATNQMDAKAAAGGTAKAPGPMETLLSALGGCSSIDIVLLLKKMRQELEDIQVEISAEREQGKEPSLFTQIHAHYRLFGNINQRKAEQAIALSIDKYCSVAQILKATVPITYSFTIHPHEPKPI